MRPCLPRVFAWALIGSCASAGLEFADRSPDVEILRAVAGLSPAIINRFQDPVGCAETTTGEIVVLDRRAHTVFVVSQDRKSVRKILEVGGEQGRVLSPAVLDVSTDDILAVADAPSGQERIQFFSLTGSRLGGFWLAKRVAPRLVIGPLVLNGVGSMHFTGKTFLVNEPDAGGLFLERDIEGTVLRQMGTLRPTSQEADRDLHLSLNIGLPLVDPTGGFYFVFQTGRPMFRKYTADGTLVFERHIEGVELDGQIQALPTTWPARAAGRLPLVSPLVRTAAVDADGRLWVSLMTPFTYVYDRRGDKTRTVQFEAGGIVSPTSVFVTRRGRLIVTPGCHEFEVR
ncbi:MAG TPA: hypothetical protein VES67_18970 [Vicinamibacterales bacterium]|nr:hypothetical protein [Vicinamibacterales bacterium]